LSWTIIDGPDVFRERKDAQGWVWTIKREGETRQVWMQVTGQATIDPDDKVRATMNTKGRSAVEGVLEVDKPPDWITFGSEGRIVKPRPTSADDASKLLAS
jgi:hypothetical protein